MHSIQSFNRYLLLFAACLMLNMLAVNLAEAKTSKSQGTLIGSWLLEGETIYADTFSNTVTFTHGGGLVNSDPTFGAGNGTWKAKGHKQYDVKFVTLIGENHPGFPFAEGGSIVVIGELTLAKQGGQTFSGSFTTQFISKFGGVFEITGVIDASRITVN